MRKFLIGLGIVVVALAALMGVVGALSPSDEVVTLTSQDAGGTEHQTPLWIVEDEGTLWLRSGNPDSGWLAQIRENPEIVLEREGAQQSYRAVPVADAAATERVNQLMNEKYGASDSLVSVFYSNTPVPIRLEPSTAVGAGPR